MKRNYIYSFISKLSGEEMEMNAPVFYSYENLDDGKYNLTMSFYVTVSPPPPPVPGFASLHTMEAGKQYYVL